MPSDTYTLVITDTGVAIPTDHASTHLIGGTDALPVASALTSGLMSTTIFNQHTANTATLSGGITATNLIGGAAGTVPYQTASGSTAMLASGSAGQVLTSNGSAAPSWAAVNLATSSVTGTLPVSKGGTGAATFLGGLVEANGTSAFTTVTKPSGDIVGTTETQTLTNKTMGSGTTFSSPISVANGGTGLGSYAVGDILYASNATTLAKLPDVATGNVLLSGGVNTAPAYGKVGLTTHVSGTLPANNGGTGHASYTIGDIVYADTATTLAKLASAATGNVLLSGGSSTAPSYGKVGLTTHVTGTLPANNGGTGYASVVRGQISKTTDTTLTVTAEDQYYAAPANGDLESNATTNMTIGTSSTFSLKNDSGGTRLFQVYASADASSANNQILSIKLYKGAIGTTLSAIDETQCDAFTSSTNKAAKLVTSWIVSLADDEEVALYIANTSGTDNITIQRMRMIAVAIL